LQPWDWLLCVHTASAFSEDGRNFIRLFRIRPQITHQDIEGIRRPVARISWYGTDHHQNYLSVAPAHLGFDTRGKDELLPNADRCCIM
jgi:hypothetical protein